MRRSPTPLAQLREEARAIELLASEADIPPDRLQGYWSLSAELITLVAEIEEWQSSIPQPGEDDPRLIALRHRLRDITARLGEMVLD